VDDILYLGLYKNTTEPSFTAVLTDIIVVSGTSYSPKELNRGDWVGVNNVFTYARQTFSPSGENWGSVTGYYIATTNNLTGTLLWVEQFASPLSMLDSAILTIDPIISVV
jgi:hypothetical protein